jgi:hypothetical protein
MLRDVIFGLVGAGLAFAWFVLVMSLSLEGRFAGEARDVLLVLGSGLAALVFLHVFMEARDNRRLRAFRAAMDEQDRRARAWERDKALRLNAYSTAQAASSTAAGSRVASGPSARIIPFPVRHASRPAEAHAR